MHAPFRPLLLALTGCAASSDGGFAPAAVERVVFEDIAAGRPVAEPGRRNRGLAVGDFDLDGDLDLYLANPIDGATLRLNDGACGFADTVSVPTTGWDAAAAAADYDADGDLDLYVACGGYEIMCENGLFRNDGPGGAHGAVSFTDVSAESGIAGAQAFGSFGGSWADYDHDGDLDLFLPAKIDRSLPENDGLWGVDELMRNNGDGTFTDVAVQAGVGEPHWEDHHQAAWGDFDNDGDLDLFVPAFGGPNRLFRNQGDGTFVDVADAVTRGPNAAFATVAEDFDHDGDLDLLVGTHSTDLYEDVGELHDHQVFLENLLEGGSLRFVDSSFSTGLAVPEDQTHEHVGTMGLQVGDVDLDGDLDVIFGNGNPFFGQVNLYWSARATGAGVRWEDRTALIDVPPAEGGDAYPYRTHGIAFFDCDEDTDIDLFLGNGGDSSSARQKEPNRLFRNRITPEGGWVSVTLEGARSNRDGVGARVEVVAADGTTRWRHQALSSGFNSSAAPELRVGLGDAPGPYTVRAHWVGGGLTEVEGVASGDEVVVRE